MRDQSGIRRLNLLWSIAVICLMAMLPSGCSNLNQEIMRFNVVEYNGAGAANVNTLAKSESGALVAQAMNGLDQTDALQRRLWETIIILPDLADGVDTVEARAIVVLNHLVRSGSPAQRARLRKLINWPAYPYGYNGVVQGLLWMIEGGEQDPETLTALTPDDCLDYAYRALPQRYPTPEDVLNYMSWHYSYVLNYYSFKSKREFFRDKTGDCTEFTLLAGDILKRQGRPVEVMLSRPTQVGGHVTLVYQTSDGYWLMDASSAALAHMIGQANRRRTLSYTEKDIITEIRPYGRLLGPAPTRDDLVELYNRQYEKPVPVKFITYQELDQAAETHGVEMSKWWDFKDSVRPKKAASTGRNPNGL